MQQQHHLRKLGFITPAIGVAIQPSLVPAVAASSSESSASIVVAAASYPINQSPRNRMSMSMAMRRQSTLGSGGRKRNSLYQDDRTLSKLTLDEELYDILYAFSETETFARAGGALSSGTARTGDSDDDLDVFDRGKPMTRQVLLNKIREKKEVIGKLRCQPWSMQRKRRTLRLAQKYLEQHESNVSKTHLYKEELMKRWQAVLRWCGNLKTYLVPWEAKIKRIESHFGSVVSSYFTFLRWIIFVNLVITLFIFFFVVLPEVLADAAADKDRKARTFSRKRIPSDEVARADELQALWHFDGYVRYSPLFYGYYSNDEFVGQKVRYSLPLAYFLITLFTFAYSFWAILRKMAANARLSKMTAGKAEQYIFNWKVFTGWDYTIGNFDTASNTVMAIIIKLRESIADCRAPAMYKFSCVKITLRIVANLLICAMLAFSIYCISFAVQSSQTVEATGNLFTKNQVPSVVATITHVFPMIFDLIGRMENYHPRTALRAHLTRVLVLYILNYLTLIIALFEKLDNIRNIARVSEDWASVNKRFVRDVNEDDSNNNITVYGRNFSDADQFHEFVSKSLDTFETKHTTIKRQTFTRNDSSSIWTTVQPEYGPVSFNSASAVLSNDSVDDSHTPRPYETIYLGPPILPTYTAAVMLTKAPRLLQHQSQVGPQLLNYSTMTSTMASTSTTSPTSKPTRTPTSRRNRTTLTRGRVIFTTRRPSTKNGANASDVRNNATWDVAGQARITTDDSVQYNDHICWETMIGQEIGKLVTMDLIITIISIILIDFVRGLWIKYCSSWWCWDIETTFPEYGEFKVAENVLHLIYNQGLIWLGLFFAPLLPAMNNIKLIIILYIRAWAVMTCNVPAREIFRASRNFYLMILLLWLLLCTLPVGYVIASKRPSTGCGPFAHSAQFYYVITHILERKVDQKLYGWIRYMASPGVIIPMLILLALVIYFLISLVRGLREANDDLQRQLIHERTEEKRKIFQLAGGGAKKQPQALGRGTKEHPKKKPLHVPEIERKRREPWRHDTTDSSLCVSDEVTAENSPDTTNAPTPLLMHSGTHLRTTPRGDNMLIPTPTPIFQPSLSSLVEAEPGSEVDHSNYYDGKEQAHGSRTMPFQHQPQQSDLVTPDEIRQIMRPFMEHDARRRQSQAVSLLGFPKDEQVTVLFPTAPTVAVGGSRRSSKRCSFVSLYENPEDYGSGAVAWPRPTRLMSPTRSSHHRNENAFVHQQRDAEGGQETEKLLPQSPAQEERTKDEELRAVMDAAANFAVLRRSTSKSSKEAKTRSAQVIQSGFQPWPTPMSSEKVRATEPTLKPDEATGDGGHNVRRFRISVSPQRRLSVDKEKKKPKQKPEKTKTEAPPPADLQQQAASTTAPVVYFGDDDSPRTHELPYEKGMH